MFLKYMPTTCKCLLTSVNEKRIRIAMWIRERLVGTREEGFDRRREKQEQEIERD